jgi:2-oxoglutarate dehydrogenase E1 component
VDSLLKQFARSSQLGANAAFLEDLYEQYLVDPDSVGPQWKAWFDGFKGREAGDIPHSAVAEAVAAAGRRATTAAPAAAAAGDERELAVGKLVTAYRSRGHLAAALDPLGMTEQPGAPDLDLGFHKLSESDLDREFGTGGVAGRERMKLRDLLALLKRTYTGPIGAEFMHISDVEQRRWLYQRLEAAGGDYGRSGQEQRRILERLTAAEGLERYLHTKYVGQKRFSLEGGDSLIPLLDVVINRAGTDGVKEVVLGMAHRGRLNVLVNTLGKPPRQLFDEFEGKFEHKHDERPHTGDVKYHMGFSADVSTGGGPVHLALAFNPSHLEIVDPVVAGRSRSRQHRRGDRERRQVLPLLMHGDAAFAAQGVVMELLQMSQARGFAVGGTLHVVINNQVGFTTSDPRQDARSTLYCTDVAKMVGAPVLHVNADDPEAVVFCAELAFDFRQRFGKDVVHRPGLLPPPRPQRGRRAGGDPAPDVPDHPPAPDHPRAVRRPARRRRHRVRAGGKGPGRRLPRQARRRHRHHRRRGGHRGRVHHRLVEVPGRQPGRPGGHDRRAQGPRPARRAPSTPSRTA